ncbi:MAG: Eco57I restriction-modification methylase domain-containing protein [Armatimonadetes bacterium]|nr:Eco57I restriction-modification methylase domain-containing protein [Armatimonadota bacterium]
MATPDRITELSDRFDSLRAQYQSSAYNETQVRRDFLDPLFRELGWDVDNQQGHAEAYRDVICEYSLTGAGPATRPDYCFQIGGRPIFFAEAKKPSVVLKDDIAAAYQIRRYAWSAKLSLSILTDFEEFAVYDCRAKPVKTDSAAQGRVLYMTYRDYAARWDEIAARFSKTAVLKGAFDEYAKSSKAKRGTADVDDAFLAELEGWREMLARNLALRNAALTSRQLNHAVQATLDRIIFLRIAEDRGIESYGQMQGLLNGTGIYGRLTKLFKDADDKYNSGLFHFGSEKGRAGSDDGWTLNLNLDDKVLKDIIKGLYFPDSPYAFAVVPADLLGQVYERFLGKVIRLTAGHQAKVEEKPEVKKAGGVYYTPTYIVDHIVRRTVEPLLEGKQPKQVATLRILDPACGSGSFLLGAYDYLLDWYLTAYSDKPAEWLKGKEPRLAQTPGGYRLTTRERKRILTDHLFGVDIDAQAVEVTKLSLLLKVLEGENEQSLNRQLSLFHERALPDLDRNIQCGNSLLGPEFYTSHLPGTLDDETEYRVNVFDWQAGFPAAMAAGGFDAVVGNPPYIRIQTLKEWAPVEVEEYKQRYRSAGRGNYDIYVVFVERGLALLNANGRLGFILPHKFTNAKYGEPLRALVAAGRHLAEVIHFGDRQVFEGATTYTCLMFLDKCGAEKCQVTHVADLAAWDRGEAMPSGHVAAADLGSGEWSFAVGNSGRLLTKVADGLLLLGDIVDQFVGVQTSADSVYILTEQATFGPEPSYLSVALGESIAIEPGLLRHIVSGTDVSRYGAMPRRQVILYPYDVTDETATLIDFADLQDRFPAGAEYLHRNRAQLEGREGGKFRDEHWYRFGRNQNIGIQSRVKLCVPRLVKRLCAAPDPDGSRCLDNVDVGGLTIRTAFADLDRRYLLAILNSRLLGWYFPYISAPFSGGFWSANRQFLSRAPIRLASPTVPEDVARHDELVNLVDQMLALHKQLCADLAPRERQQTERRITATDTRIDQIVYELYGLSDKEIALVEDTTG